MINPVQNIMIFVLTLNGMGGGGGRWGGGGDSIFT
jgi:hypothetical protein